VSTTTKALLAVGAALAICACSGAKSGSADRGGATIQVTTSALSVDVTEVTVDVLDGGDTIATVTLTKTSARTFEGFISGLPLGIPLTFAATAVSGPDGRIYTGSATTTIDPVSRVAVVSLKLQEVAPPSSQNHAPRLTALTSSARFVLPGSDVTVAITAEDPDGDTLSFAWTAASGSFADPTLPTAVWTAPSISTPTDVVLAVTVSDGQGGFAKASLLVTVTSESTLQNVAVVAILNDAPQMSISNAPQYEGTTPFPNQLTLTVTDPDGPTPHTFLWEVDLNAAPGCVGDFYPDALSAPDPTVQSPLFVPTLPGDGGLCAATVTVTDGLGASNVGTVVFAVDLPPTNVLPRLVFSFQSATTVGAGATALVKASFLLGIDPVFAEYTWTANQPDADPITFTPDTIDLDLMLVAFPVACHASGPVAYTIRATALDPVTSVPTTPPVFKEFVITLCP
jgi:hypothetical protein